MHFVHTAHFQPLLLHALQFSGCGPQELYSLGPGLDLEFETESSLMVPEPAQYETIYVTSHKAQCRAGAFNADGTLIATGEWLR